MRAMGVNLPEMQYLWVSRPAFGWQGGLGEPWLGGHCERPPSEDRVSRLWEASPLWRTLGRFLVGSVCAISGLRRWI